MSKALRIDPTKNVEVLALSHRARRPHVKKKKECPFCPGREHLTPPTTFALPSRENWRVRCFQNMFPITPSHEVIVETPRHDELFQQLGDEQLALVFEAYKNRFLELQKRARFVFLFKNHGLASGASIPHEHAQIISLDFVPVMMQRELDAFNKEFRETGESVYCTLLKKEKKNVLLRKRGFTAFAPSFARFPCELWIVPERHVHSFTELGEGEAIAFMQLLRECVARVTRFASDYTIAFHNPPRGANFHFHAEIYPRKNVWGGVELGTGLIINPKTEKDALKELK